jgi:hypothetical protein
MFASMNWHPAENVLQVLDKFRTMSTVVKFENLSPEKLADTTHSSYQPLTRALLR